MNATGKHFVKLTFATALFIAVSQGYAVTITCTPGAMPNAPVTVASMNFPRDAPVGSTTNTYDAIINFSCPGDPGADRDIFLTFAVVPVVLAAGHTDVYPTNVAGVGVRYTISNGTGTSCNYGVKLPVAIDNASKRVTCHQMQAAASPGYKYSLVVSTQFVKTAPATVGTLTTIPAVSVTNSINNQSGSFLWGNALSGTASGAFASMACAVSTSTVAVTIPNAYAKDFPAIGSTAGNTTFGLDLYCDAGVKVFVTLTDAAQPTNSSTTLSLSPDSTAQGIGYQILYAGTVIAYGPDSPVAGNLHQFSASSGVVSGGPFTVLLVARYVRTGMTRSGTANAKATFTMSYQ